MAKATRSTTKPTRKVGPRSGLTRTTVYLEPSQLDAVAAEARRRAERRGVMRLDASEVVREAIAAWMKR